MSRRRSPRSGLATESASTAASPIDRAAAFARSRAAAPVAVGVLMLVSILARVWLARAVKTPWILADEFIYSEEAKSFARAPTTRFAGRRAQSSATSTRP